MRPRGSLTGPLIVIAIGAIFLVRAISPNFRLPEFIALYWPYLLIGWGVIALFEIFIRALRGAPIPTNGISGGGWVVVIFICLFGLAAFQIERPDNWWRRFGFERGIETFGEAHDYSFDTIQQSVGATPHVVIENFRGDAKITGGDANDISVGGHKTVRAFDSHEADRANAATPVEVIVEGDRVVVRCNQGRASSHTFVKTDLDISVPKGATVEADGSSGDFDVSAISGDVNLRGVDSGVRLQDIGGNVKVDTRRSEIVRCTNVKGTVDLNGHGTEVELSDIGGEVSLNGDYTGTVSLRQLSKPVRIENLRTELTLDQIAGEVRLDRGSITAQNLIGPVKLNTRSTDVTMTDFTNGLEMTVERGDIDLRPGHLPLGSMTVHTRSGNIELTLPSAAKFALTASTDHGEIDNQFDATFRQRTQGSGAHLEGSLGGGPDIHLVADRGSITVRKATVTPTATAVSDTRASTATAH